jgi:hypothetical protein
MGLPAAGVPMKASMINAESATTNVDSQLAGTGGATAPSAGSFIKRFDDALPTPVNQIKPYAYSDFYGKSFNPPPISCGTSTAAIGQGAGQGYFEAQIDFGTTTGAVVIYFCVYSIPDGISFLYNGVTYNMLTSNTDGIITAASGTNNIVGSGSETALINGSPWNNITKSVWNGTYFGSTGNTVSGLVSLATNINLSTPNQTYTLVIPKTAASPSNGVLKIFGNPISSTGWRVTAPCPITLPSFTTNSVNSTFQGACCATQNQTYYFARNATIFSPTGVALQNFVIDTNTLPQVNNFVFSDSTGATALANGYYKITSNTAIYVQNGVVDSISTGCGSCTTDFQSSDDQTFGGVCLAPISYTYSHDGATTYPTAGDSVFDENDDPVVSGYYKFNSTYVYKTTSNVVDVGWPQNFC